MLDDLGKLTAADTGGFLAKLSALPGSYEGPQGLRAEPYGLIGFGETASVARALQSWVDAPLVVSGTQFMFASGFDYGELAPLRLSAEMAGAEVVLLGYAAYEPSYRVERGVLSAYTYTSYLAHATGHTEALEAAERIMFDLRERLSPEVPTEQNPAKALAWTLWNRVPLLFARRADAALPELLQHLFARVGKTLAISVGEHPLEVLSGALEGRHVLGDDLIGIIVGQEDEEMRLAREVLSSRVAQVESLGLPFGGVGETLADAGARALVLWYAGLWVAAYTALLHGLSPEDAGVYDAVTKAAGI